MELDWGKFKSILQDLYMVEDLSLEQVRERMKAHHFYATKAQYELQFKKWNFRKYRTADEWKIIASKVTKRKAENKDSKVILDDNISSGLQEGEDSISALYTHDVHISVLNEMKGMTCEKASRSFTQIIEARVPDNVFQTHSLAENSVMSPRQASPTLDFVKLTMYLISNNFFESTSAVSKKVYKWIKRRSNSGLMEYRLSIGGPTVDALSENLFQLAIDNEDFRMIQKPLNFGIDPNEIVCHYVSGSITPLQRACQLRSVEIVRALVEKGANVNSMVDRSPTALTYALDFFNQDTKQTEGLVDIDLVQILLDAGADVNPSPNESPLSEAADSGHVQAVELLLSAGADVNFMDQYRCTSLMKTVGCELDIPNQDVITISISLLKAGADPNTITIYDGEFLNLMDNAMTRQSFELIEVLLTYGARVTEADFISVTRSSSIDMAKLLLKYKGPVTISVIKAAIENKDPNMIFFLLATTEESGTRLRTAAFSKAVEHGRVDLIQWLDVGGVQFQEHTQLDAAIQAATKRGDIRVLALLLDSSSKYRSICLESLGTSLLTAIKQGRSNIVELLLTAGANINAGFEGASPLKAVIDRKDILLVRKLLNAGAEVNKTEYYCGFGRLVTTSVLPAVVSWGFYPLIQQIISAGADIDAPDSPKGKTALSVAVKKGDWATVQLLIEAGININFPEDFFTGNTALAAACKNNDLNMVQYLLNLGADPDETSLVDSIPGSIELVKMILAARLNRYKRYSKGYGCRALQYAIKLEKASMIDFLLTQGIEPDTIIQPRHGDKKAAAGRLKQEPNRNPYPIYGESAMGSAIRLDKSIDGWMVQLLLDRGANPNGIVATFDYRTALLVAIDRGSSTLVNMLISAGADPNAIIISGVKRTPLQFAVEKGRMEIVKILIGHGVDINVQPFHDHGATALQFAAIVGYIPIARILLENGADVNALAAQIGGRTALEAAAEHGRIDMLDLILSAGALITGPGVQQYERAREFAKKDGYISARKLLEKHNADMLEIMELWDPMQMDSGNLDDFQV